MIKKWLLPFLLAGFLFTLVRPALAQTITPPASLAQQLISGDVEVNSEMGENGFRQIYYLWGEEKHFITDTPYSNGHPDSGNEYITWMGQSTNGSWQIFLHNLLTGSTIQLSAAENNANPVTSGGRVAWEGWVDGNWQIFLFDGIKVSQVTSGQPSLNPDLNQNYFVYAVQDQSGQWISVGHSFTENKTMDLFVGSMAKHTRLQNGKVRLPDNSEVSVSSFFALDLGSIGNPASPSAVPIDTPTPDKPLLVSEAEILEEISPPSTSSAVIPSELPLPSSALEETPPPYPSESPPASPSANTDTFTIPATDPAQASP